MISIGTLNLNGARDKLKRLTLMDFINIKKLQVMFLQETHSDAINEIDWRKEWCGSSFFSHGSNVSGGVAILFSKSFNPLPCHMEELVKGRLLKVTAFFDDLKLIFLNVYAPVVGAERVLFLNKLNEILNDVDQDALLFLSGDFNCTEDEKLDRNHPEPHAPSQRAMVQVISANGLSDVWRVMHEGARQYTWSHSRDNYLSLARLDRIYVFKCHRNILKSCRILPTGFSDHSAVICNVFTKSFKPKSAYWCFNTSLLEDKHFVETFNYFWETFQRDKGTFPSLLQWWDYGKTQIKLFCQQYTYSVTKEITRSLKALENDILLLQNSFKTSGDADHIKSLEDKKATLNELLGVRAQGALVRSRFQNITHMDAPSKFFFNLERKNGQSRLMHSLRTETGQEITEPGQMRDYARLFYSRLYDSELNCHDMSSSIFFNGLPTVDKESNDELKQMLSLQELEQALWGMENGKSPGIDGLPVEFYKVFWPTLGKDLLLVLRESLKKGFLPHSCRRAVITLLPKKGNLQELGNWRPVSLLCTDSKIFSKSLALRLKKVIAQVIHPDQSYCIPERSIFDNIAVVRDLMTVSKCLGTNIGLISLDQQKAYDRAEFQYLWHTLKCFGFSSEFISMVKILYCDIESVLKVNGGLSAPFKVKRGVRQGCPMSGMLYSLAIEPFLHTLRAKLKGISLPFCDNRFHLSAYADDICTFVNCEDDVKTLSDIVNDFQTVSSAKVNWGKSDALWVGNWEGRCSGLPGGLSWKRGGLKYLGVFLGDDSFVTKNWEGVLDKVKGRLGKWKWLLPHLSYRGRTLIINNLVASALWHKFACVEPPKWLLDSVQRELVNFFWDQLHWVPQSVLFLSKEDGGQGLMNLVSRRDAYRLQFIQRFLTAPDPLVWRPLAQCILHQVSSLGLDFTLFLMDNEKLTVDTLPPFYKSLFRAWGLFNCQRGGESSLQGLLEEPILFGARLDVSGDDLPGLTNVLCKKKMLLLKDIVNRVGANFQNVEMLASFLEVKSVRYVERFLCKLQQALNHDERLLLNDYVPGDAQSHDGIMAIHNVFLSPVLQGVGDTSPLLAIKDQDVFGLSSATGKMFYRTLVKVLNKHTLMGRSDTVWREKLGIPVDIAPVWRVLYKPPLSKRSGDLQWRILHGAIGVNAFVAVINPAFSDKCPFCDERETIYHCFTECIRLCPLFLVLKSLMSCMGIMFTMVGFILGFPYSQQRRAKCQLINFIVGQAKLAIYLSRKKKVQCKEGDDALTVFRNLVKSRVLLDFAFYKLMSAIEVFEEKWCCNGALCTVLDDEIAFNYFFV